MYKEKFITLLVIFRRLHKDVFHTYTARKNDSGILQELSHDSMYMYMTICVNGLRRYVFNLLEVLTSSNVKIPQHVFEKTFQKYVETRHRFD